MSDQQMKTWSDITQDLLGDAIMGEINFVSPNIYSLFIHLDEYFQNNDDYIDENGCELRSLYGDYINDIIIDVILEQSAVFSRNGNYWNIREIDNTDGLCEYVKVYTMSDGINMTNQQLWTAAAGIVFDSADAKNIDLNKDMIPYLNNIRVGISNTPLYTKPVKFIFTVEDFENAQAALKAAPYHFTDLNGVRWKLHELMGDVFFIKYCDDVETGERLYIRYTSEKGVYVSYERHLSDVDFNNVI